MRYRRNGSWLLSIILIGCCVTLHSCRQTNSKRAGGADFIRKCLEAHGGIGATDSLRIAFIATNIKTEPGQSLNAMSPFEEYALRYEYLIDRPAGLEITRIDNSIAGFEFSTASFLKNDSGYRYDIHAKKYWPMNTRMAARSFLLPQNLLSEVLKNPYSIRHEENVIEDGKNVLKIAAVKGSELVYVYIDKATMLVDKVEQFISNGVYGDGSRETKYEDYIRSANVFMPAKVTVSLNNKVNGTVTNVFTISNIRDIFVVDTSRMSVPEGYTAMDFTYRKKGEVSRLADNIYLVENVSSSLSQFSYNVLFAEFDKYVLVAEAPLDDHATQYVLQKIRETVPGKPVKYLVQSHHHDDHLGGIREYIAEGVTIVTTQSNLPLLEKIAKADFETIPDKLALQPRAVITEVVKDKTHIIKDARNEVKIYDIGPNPHANEMLVLYFPGQKLMYQSDMVNKGEFPVNITTMSFLKKLAALSLDIHTMAGLHGQTLNKEEIQKLLTTQTLE